MCFPSEWCWNDRMCRRVSGDLGSTQCWNIFLTPPSLCKKLGHVRIDQCEEDVNSERNLDANSWNFPEVLCSHVAAIWSSIAILPDNFVESSWFCVYPFPLMIRHWNHRGRQHRTWCLYRSCLRNGFFRARSMWVSSDISLTYLFIPFTILTHEQVPSPKKVDPDLDSVTFLMITDGYMQNCTDLCVSTDPSFHLGWFITSK